MTPSNRSAPALLRSWIEDAARRVGRAGGRASLEIVLGHLWAIGQYAERFGLAAQAHALVARIVGADGALPLTRGIEGGAWDLAVAAVSARADLGRHLASLQARGPMPRPHRVPYDAFEGLSPPAREHVKPAAARARMRVLDGELGRLRYAPSRCYVVAEQAAWVPDADATALFDAMTVPIFDAQGRVRYGAEMLCRARTALSMEEVAAPRRIALALRLLRATPDEILPFDMGAVETGPAIVVETDKAQVAAVAASAVAAHLAWVDASAELRDWLGHALVETDRAPDHEEATGTANAELEAAYERLVAFDLAHGRAPEARAILKAWIDAVRGTIDQVHYSVYPIDLATLQIFALGDLAVRVGLEAPARALFEAIRRGRSGSGLARRLAIAEYMLATAKRAPSGVASPAAPAPGPTATP